MASEAVWLKMVPMAIADGFTGGRSEVVLADQIHNQISSQDVAVLFKGGARSPTIKIQKDTLPKWREHSDLSACRCPLVKG